MYGHSNSKLGNGNLVDIVFPGTDLYYSTRL
jgi:hypothetical protein